MIKHIVAAAAIGLLSTSAYAAQDAVKEVPPAASQNTAKVQTAIPQDAVTVTDWYKQDVFDGNDNKVGQIKDVLVDQSGKIDTLIVAVGGFLGAGEKGCGRPVSGS
jgi:hypothetical protein